MSAKKPPADDKPKVPGYIVTFSDMVTLLLTFFVLLLSLAEEQNPALFDIGKDSFKKSIGTYGLGMLMGREMSNELGKILIKHRVEEAEETEDNRTIDADEESLKRQFENIKQSVNTLPSQIVARKVDFNVADIKFPNNGMTLDDEGCKYLKDFAKDLQQNANNSSKMLYVLGLADFSANDKQNWTISAQRARVVADFIRNSLAYPDQWEIYSWGAGPGGDWVNEESPLSDKSDIYIAILNG